MVKYIHQYPQVLLRTYRGVPCLHIATNGIEMEAFLLESVENWQDGRTRG